MNTRLQKALECKPSDHVPFIPAVYEHKASFIGETPSRVCRDVDLFTNAVLAEYEQICPDALTIGIDVYNIEAEAVGSIVTYYEGEDTSIPAIASDGAVFHGVDDVASLHMPDPIRDGRMPINLEVANNVLKALGKEVPVRGAVSGPFSMAAHLVGPERLFILTITQPDLVRELLGFSAEVIKKFGEAYINVGCGVAIFDSQASPEILSPAMYREFVLSPTQAIIRHFLHLGLQHVPLIIGGDTTKILALYLGTGANNILCDVRCDAARFLSGCSIAKRAFRRNIDSTQFLTARPEEVYQSALRLLTEAHGYPGFILGTGVVPYGTPTAILAAVRHAIHEFQNIQTVYSDVVSRTDKEHNDIA
jgi:uroporphyrinogen decarboxylase